MPCQLGVGSGGAWSCWPFFTLTFDSAQETPGSAREPVKVWREHAPLDRKADRSVLWRDRDRALAGTAVIVCLPGPDLCQPPALATVGAARSARVPAASALLTAALRERCALRASATPLFTWARWPVAGWLTRPHDRNVLRFHRLRPIDPIARMCAIRIPRGTLARDRPPMRTSLGLLA